MATIAPAPARMVVGGYMLHVKGRVREAECARAGEIGGEARRSHGGAAATRHVSIPIFFSSPTTPNISDTLFSPQLFPKDFFYQGQQCTSEE